MRIAPEGSRPKPTLVSFGLEARITQNPINRPDSVQLGESKAVNAVRCDVRPDLTLRLPASLFADHNALDLWIGKECSQINDLAIELTLGQE